MEEAKLYLRQAHQARGGVLLAREAASAGEQAIHCLELPHQSQSLLERAVGRPQATPVPDLDALS